MCDTCCFLLGVVLVSILGDIRDAKLLSTLGNYNANFCLLIIQSFLNFPLKFLSVKVFSFFFLEISKVLLKCVKQVLRGIITIISQYLSIVVSRDLLCYFSRKSYPDSSFLLVLYNFVNFSKFLRTAFLQNTSSGCFWLSRLFDYRSFLSQCIKLSLESS